MTHGVRHSVCHRSRVRGCLLGGAIGDALGAPVEMVTIDGIRAEYGPEGVRGFVSFAGGLGLITDDTQLTLFTAEGLIRAGRGGTDYARAVHAAGLRWLDTQNLPGPPATASGWLAGGEWLYARRGPGKACLSGFSARTTGTPAAPANPNSKGCGAVMRSAPFGLIGLPLQREPLYGNESDVPTVFGLAAECAMQTHGHPTGYLAAGAYAELVARLARGAELGAALDAVLASLAGRPGHEETSAALTAARSLAASDIAPSAAAVRGLGEGWVAEETLAIAVYCASVFPAPDQFRSALALAVNHSGDSDSTGSVCGGLLGAGHGETVLPADLVVQLEGRATITGIADDLTIEFGSDPGTGDHRRTAAWLAAYPG